MTTARALLLLMVGLGSWSVPIAYAAYYPWDAQMIYVIGAVLLSVGVGAVVTRRLWNADTPQERADDLRTLGVGALAVAVWPVLFLPTALYFVWEGAVSE